MARDTDSEMTMGLILGCPSRPFQMRPPTSVMRSASDGFLLRWCTSVKVSKTGSPSIRLVPKSTSLSPMLPTTHFLVVLSIKATAAVVPSINSSSIASLCHSSSVRARALLRAACGSSSRARRSEARSSAKRSPENSAARAPPCPSKTAKKERLPSTGSVGETLPISLKSPLIMPISVKSPLVTPRRGFAQCASSISGRVFWMECTPYRTGHTEMLLVKVRARLPDRRGKSSSLSMLSPASPPRGGTLGTSGTAFTSSASSMDARGRPSVGLEGP
mmetsp:Transcript_25441/g.85088  ORF Transcript_25441/g.85088 Transcript_25441/m.85088 type:complete len:275 (-) Transcript_25441:17-841(-)